MTEPLLTHRPGSETSNEHSEDQHIEEQDALLTGQRTGKQSPSPPRTATSQRIRSKWREIGLFVWSTIATAAVIVLAVLYQHGRGGGLDRGGGEGSGKRNLIFMVSDGMGPTSLSLTRSWRHYAENTPYDQTLILDDYLIGQSRTRSSTSLVTDSAAGATAFSCGMKSYNGAISVLPNFSPCGSVMEAAKRRGYTTGLVVTTRITDATPAVFVSHARRREMEDMIARQMIGETHPLGRMVDLMMGGGKCHFLPNTTSDGCRHDDIDVIKIAKQRGWNYIDSKPAFSNLDASHTSLPLLALFAPTDFPYEIDRQHQAATYPSLEEMTHTALRTLAAATRDTEQGFFIMIEGSRIDHAGHANDPAAQVREILAYDRAMRAVLTFIEEHERQTGVPTLMISTSDHETGGLSVAKQLTSEYPEYVWYPDALTNVSRSASWAAGEYHRHLSQLQPSLPPSSPSAYDDEPEGDELTEAGKTAVKTYLTRLSHNHLGIPAPSADDLANLLAHPSSAAYTFADMVSRRAQTGWSTHGHSGADVNIYASDHTAAATLRGGRENTDVGAFLRKWLGVEAEVHAVTRELKRYTDGKSDDEEAWLGAVPEQDERLDGQDHAKRYAGGHHDHSGVRCDVCGF